MFNKKNVDQAEPIVNNNDDVPKSWERKLVEQVISASMIETRRARRWKVFFQFLGLIYLTVISLLLARDQVKGLLTSINPHSSVIDIEGVIASDSKASADNIVTGLRQAFDDTNTKGIILRINSPGGSPVQAGYVYDEIRRLRAEHADIPVYAVIVDMGASAAYYIAAAADAIYADKASIVGSIGVLMNGFGFAKAIENIGVERRLLTAGNRKGVLDPFSPLKDEDRVFAKEMLDRIHQQFITAVKDGRTGKLKDDPDLFSGLFWNGEEAKELGLIDGLGNTSYVARKIIGEEEMVIYTHKEPWIERFSEQMGSYVTNMLLAATTPKLW